MEGREKDQYATSHCQKPTWIQSSDDILKKKRIKQGVPSNIILLLVNMFFPRIGLSFPNRNNVKHLVYLGTRA